MHPPRLHFAGAGLKPALLGARLLPPLTNRSFFAEGLAKALVFTRRPSTQTPLSLQSRRKTDDTHPSVNLRMCIKMGWNLSPAFLGDSCLLKIETIRPNTPFLWLGKL